MTTARMIDHPVVQYGDIGLSFLLFGRVNCFEVVKDLMNFTQSSNLDSHMIKTELLKVDIMKATRVKGTFIWKRDQT